MNAAPARNLALDAYRGFVMLLMMAEVLHFSQIARAFPENWVWQTLAYHQSHVEWAGCSLHDLIQPSFSFLVGVALPYSIASRLAKGGSVASMLTHTCWRALVLIALGIFLRSTHSTQTNFTFEDTLTQIGLGIRSCSFSAFGCRVGSGRHWEGFWLVIGSFGRSIRFRRNWGSELIGRRPITMGRLSTAGF